jgi:hypothetical protein
MKTVISAASVLACVLSLNAQITAIVKPLPDRSDVIRIRNDAAVSLVAYAVSVKIANEASDAPILEYVDSEIDTSAVALLPTQEHVVTPAFGLPSGRSTSGRMIYRPAHYEQAVVTAGIFADGTTSGDAELLRRLILRRCNMLQAVETTLDIISDAGRRNVPRDLLVNQFRKMADSLNRWYVPPEQRVGHDLYQSMMGKLLNLPDEPVGSPFPPDAFVAEETAMLNRQRTTLLESQPGLAEAAVIRR